MHTFCRDTKTIARQEVSEIQGAAKNGNAKAGPINAPNWARDDYKTGDKYD